MRFIYVFTEDAKEDMLRRGFSLVMEDTHKHLCVFENKENDGIEMFSERDYQFVLSNDLVL